jgi:hypothetical protein
MGGHSRENPAMGVCIGARRARADLGEVDFIQATERPNSRGEGPQPMCRQVPGLLATREGPTIRLLGLEILEPRSDVRQQKKTYTYDPHLAKEDNAERASLELLAVSRHFREPLKLTMIIETMQRRNDDGHHAEPPPLDTGRSELLREGMACYQQAHDCCNWLIMGDAVTGDEILWVRANHRRTMGSALFSESP